MDKLLHVSPSPHTHAKHNVQSVMRDVIIALIPALLVSIYFFGFRALGVVFVTTISCVAFEALWVKYTKQQTSIKDLSAIVTGILLAFNMPANVPIYVPIVGSFVAVILAKGLFGGIGQNFINPALAARAFLLAAYPTAMTTFGPYNGGIVDINTIIPTRSMDMLSGVSETIDVISQATPLALFKEYGIVATPSVMDAFIGNINGCIGEVSALALLLGGLYLIYRKIITWHIPVCYLGSIFIVGVISGNGIQASLYSLMLGGAILGAFFMATDYTTTPMTIKGQVIFAVSAGLIAGIIRTYGGYPEGVSYSILLMNLCVPLIDRYVKNTPFGRKKA
ncbi:MAG: RnfABCDGE type electron transport complex subunit D [Cellulosilyticaceae bacterium]